MKTYTTRVRRAIGLGLMLLLLAATGSRLSAEQFVPILEWLTLQQVNEREGTSLAPYELNTPQSQIQLLGEFSSNYVQTWYPAIDSSRGVLYLSEIQNGPYSGGVGDIAVVDLKTLAIRRRMTIQSGEEGQMTPSALAIDPVGNRLFVSDSNRQRVWIIDATSGAVQHLVQPGYPFNERAGLIAHPYSAATNRLYLVSGPPPLVWGALDLADLAAPIEPFNPVPPGTFVSGESYTVINDEAKLAYIAIVPDGFVFAIDLDPSSASFHQVVWTGAGTMTRQFGYLQPAIDLPRQRLYVPDVVAGVIRVFDARRGPTLHQELAPISLASYLSQAPGVGLQIGPEVDPLTGIIYAVLSSDGCLFQSDCEGFESSVVAIDPSVGVVGRAPLPASISRQPGTFIMLDPATRRIIVGTGDLGPTIAVLEDLRPTVLSTPASGGTPVTVTAPEASITFDSVSAAGSTTITPKSLDGIDVALPGQFSIDGSLLYEVSTSATTAGPITLCFSAAHVNDPAAFEALYVLHGENGQWVNRTTSRNFETRTICAQTSSLSPFAIAKLTTPSYAPRLLYTIDRAFRAGSTAPIKVQVLDWSGANVSAATLSLRAVSLNRTSSAAALTIDDSGGANPDADFRYDADLNGYIFNLNTRGLAPGIYTLTADVGGRGHFIQLPFSIR